MKRLQITSSKYAVEYEEGKEYNYRIMRGNEDIGEHVKNNIVFDMFQMILNQQEEINELKKQISDDGLALNSMNAQMGLMRNKAAGEIEELLKRATEAERKLAILKEAFDIITGKETK